MFSDNSDNPLESLFKIRPSFLLFDQNPASKQEDSPFFSDFPAHFFDEPELPLNQILPSNLLMGGSHLPAEHQAQNNEDNCTKKEATKRGIGASKLKGKAGDDQPISNGVVAPSRRRTLGGVPRKRTGKKDRHSKICTAHGIRDRRMRLSLQVARKFFDLQDMLGYDKASKTIEWLFNKSKKAIKELTKDVNPQGNVSMSDAKSESFLSECEVVSGIEQDNSNTEVNRGILPNNEGPLCPKTFMKDEKKSPKNVSKTNMKESREKARARARSRTREKMMIQGLENWCKSSPNYDDLQKLGSSSCPYEAGLDHQESGPQSQERVSPYRVDNPPLADVGTIEKLLENSGSSAACPISDYYCSGAVSCFMDPNSSFMGFLGNWELLNNDRLTSSHNSVTNQVPLAGNPNSDYSPTTPNFPLLFHQ